MLVTIFNDADRDNTRSLETAIHALPGIDTLTYAPQVMMQEVGEDVVRAFEQMQLVPTLFFIDPWGYKGLSLRLVNSVLKDWGCDCIFFFNYNRISMGLGNDLVREHMDALFGRERADVLRRRLEAMAPADRELAIIEELVGALKEMGGKYVLPFRFRSASGSRTSHHLIFISKHPKGYDMMKEIMAAESSSADQGVPSLEYNPADARYPLLFQLSRPLDELEGMLLSRFAGRRLTVRQIYNEHNIGTRYILKNYKDALRSLESRSAVTAEPPAQRRLKRSGEVTFADSVYVTFPRRVVAGI